MFMFASRLAPLAPIFLLSFRSPTLGIQVAQTHHSPWDFLEVGNFSGNSSPWFAWNVVVCELSCVLPTSLPTIGFHKCKTFQLLAHLISHPVVHPTTLFQSRHGGKAGFCEKAINSYSFAIPEMKAHSFEVLREAASSSSKNMKSVWFHWFFIVSATPGWRTWTVGASSRPRCSEWTTKLRQLAGANFWEEQELGSTSLLGLYRVWAYLRSYCPDWCTRYVVDMYKILYFTRHIPRIHFDSPKHWGRDELRGTFEGARLYAEVNSSQPKMQGRFWHARRFSYSLEILIEDVVGASEQASNLTSAASLSRPRPRFLGIWKTMGSGWVRPGAT